MKDKKKIISIASLVIVFGVIIFAALNSSDLQGAVRNKRIKKPITTTQAQTCGNGTINSGEACDDGNIANGDGCSSTCTIETPMGTAYVNISTPGGNTGLSQQGWLQPVTIATCAGNENEWIPILQTYMIIDDRNFRLDRLPFMARKAGTNTPPQDPQAFKMTVSTDHQNWQGTAVGEYVINNPESVAQQPGGYFLIETGGLNLSANTTYYLTFSIQRNPVTLNAGEDYEINASINTSLVYLAGINYGEFLPGPIVGGQISPVYPHPNMQLYQLGHYTKYTMVPCSN